MILPLMLNINHDRLRFSYSVPAQSGFVHKLNSTLKPFSDGNATESEY